jgi:hypothetical protein
MKRFHVHAHVEDITASVAFYSKMFAAPPTRLESDYAKWMLEDPRINFAISTRGSRLGVDHLGIQTDTEEELLALRAQAEAAELGVAAAGETSCCYARSNKHWLTDPQGIAWEQFHTLANIPLFGESPQASIASLPSLSAPEVAAGQVTTTPEAAPACCAPKRAAPRGKALGIAVAAAPGSSCC